MFTPTPVETGFRLTAARRILVIKLDEMGDFVLATPFLRGLRASAPQARIALVVLPAVLPLTVGCPYADSVVALAGDAGNGKLDFRGRTPNDLKGFAADFGAGFDAVVTPRYDLDRYGAATLAAASRAPVRLSFTEAATPWKASGNAGFDRAYTHLLAPVAPRHEVMHNLALLTALGGADPAAADGSPVALWLDAADRAAAARMLDDGFGGRRPDRVLALAPTTAGPRRNMPVPRFAAIVRTVADRLDAGVAVLGSAEGMERAAALSAALAPRLPVADLTGRTDLRTAAAVIEGATALIGMDSGPAHMAAALGVPVVVASCHPDGGDPNDLHAPDRFRPWTGRALVLRPARAQAPCTDACRSSVAHCIATIDPDEAARAVVSFLAPERGEPAPAPLRALRRAEVLAAFPRPAEAWPADRHWHAQLAHFVVAALHRRFGDRVRAVPWGAEVEPAGRDVFVSLLPHPLLARWKRSVVLENLNFDVDKWRHGAFRRYGFDVPLDRTAETMRWLEGQYALSVLGNDVTIARCRAGDPQVAACHDHLKRSVVAMTLHPHPIDKAFFSRLFGQVALPERARMLVYHGGPRKNSAELIALLRRLGFREGADFAVSAYVDKNDDAVLARLLSRFLVVASASYSETGPVNMIEYMLSGHLVYGHEDWWAAEGEPRLCWTYDPARQEENAAALDWLLRQAPMPELMAIRDRRRQSWLDRADTGWPSYTDVVCERVAELLEATHPA